MDDKLRVCDWSQKDVQEWLGNNNLKKYIETFVKNEIDGDTLTMVDEHDMEILSIDLDDRDIILDLVLEAQRSENLKKQDVHVTRCSTDRTKTKNMFSRGVNIYNPKTLSDGKKSIGRRSRMISLHPSSIWIDERENVEEWTVGDVIDFLRKNELSKFSLSFRYHQIDGPTLLELRSKDLQLLGIKEKDNRDLILELKKYKKRKNRR